MFGKKQSISNSDWLKAMETIEQTIQREEIKRLVSRTVKDIRKHVKGISAAYAWSGGKDSIVLDYICREAGLSSSMIGVCNLEYPSFSAWIEQNKPDGCEIINTGQDLQWLAMHQEMIFPEKSDIAARWFAIVQHSAQRKYVKAHDVDILLLGRRRTDGNFVGRGTNIYTSKGVTRYSPLADWRHEDVLACIHYFDLPMPPIYDWYNGYKCGTHPWPARQWTNGNGWAEVYAIDSDIIKKAAAYIPAAAEYLQEVQHD